MKFDYQKAFPYPVLRPSSDDYITSEFQAVVDVSVGGEENAVHVSVDFMTSADEIDERVDRGQAAYAIVISCRETFLREVYSTQSKTLHARFKAGNFKGEVVVQPYVTVEEVIDDFSSVDINSEFGAGPFSFKRGQILAMDEPNIFYIDRDLFRPITSVFELVKDESHSAGQWTVRLEEDHVQIALSPAMKESIDDARNATANKAILVNSLYFSAVTHAVQAVKESNDYDDYRWAMVLRRQCHNHGLDLNTHSAYLVAQGLLNEPLALLKTYVFGESSE